MADERTGAPPVEDPPRESGDCDVVVVGASAGGVEALIRVVGGLPPDLGAAVLVVLHVSPSGTSVLPAILQRAGQLPAQHAIDGQALERGRVYVAPPDRHLIVEDSRLSVTRAPKINGHRPAIDPLFRSAAATFGARVAGIVLSGSLDDGAAGLRAIKAAGGHTVVQDPEDSLYPAMPLAAIGYARPDHIVPAAEIGPLVTTFVENGRNPGNVVETQEVRSMQTQSGKLDFEDVDSSEVAGRLTSVTCPECGGAIWRSSEDGVTQLRCHVGHAYSVESFLAQHSATLEGALWTAIRALEERNTLARGVARRLRDGGHEVTADRFDRQAQVAEEHAAMLRHVAESLESLPSTAGADTLAAASGA